MTRSYNDIVRAMGGVIVAAALVLTTVFAATAQDRGGTPSLEIISACKLLMSAIDGLFADIEVMFAPGGKVDLAYGGKQADIISIMLTAFPHLFPSSTNQWKPNADRDPATDTYASPELWNKFADFNQRVTEASKIAFDLSKAERAEDFKALAARLRAGCDSCHAAYMKTE